MDPYKVLGILPHASSSEVHDAYKKIVETYNTENCAFMYYSPEQGEGYMMLFRPEGSDVEEQTFMLKGLDEGATYTLTVQDTDQTMEMDGKALMESGITATFPEARSAKFIWITKN